MPFFFFFFFLYGRQGNWSLPSAGGPLSRPKTQYQLPIHYSLIDLFIPAPFGAGPPFCPQAFCVSLASANSSGTTALCPTWPIVWGRLDQGKLRALGRKDSPTDTERGQISMGLTECEARTRETWEMLRKGRVVRRRRRNGQDFLMICDMYPLIWKKRLLNDKDKVCYSPTNQKTLLEKWMSQRFGPVNVQDESRALCIVRKPLRLKKAIMIAMYYSNQNQKSAKV